MDSEKFHSFFAEKWKTQNANSHSLTIVMCVSWAWQKRRKVFIVHWSLSFNTDPDHVLFIVKLLLWTLLLIIIKWLYFCADPGAVPKCIHFIMLLYLLNGPGNIIHAITCDYSISGWWTKHWLFRLPFFNVINSLNPQTGRYWNQKKCA